MLYRFLTRRSKILLVPGGGIEPPLCCQNWILSPARLPIPPSRPAACIESAPTGQRRRVSLGAALPARGEAGIIAERARRFKPRTSSNAPHDDNPQALPPFRFRFRSAERADRASPRAGALGKPPAARCTGTPCRSCLWSLARAAGSGRSPGLQRYPGRAFAHRRSQAQRRQGRADARAHRRAVRGLDAVKGQSCAARRRDDRAPRRRIGVGVRARRALLPTALRRADDARGLSRAAWRRAAASVHRASTGGGRCGALSNRICAPSGRRGSADRGAAFRPGLARRAARA